MALHSDTEPPLRHGSNKIKNLIIKYPKIKNQIDFFRKNQAKAFFLMSNYFTTSGKQIFLSIKKLLHFFRHQSKYASHISIALVTSVAVLSNFVARYAKAETFIPVAAPKNSISLATSIDAFTPIVKNDGQLLDKSYAATTEAFSALNPSVETQLTQRVEPLPDNSQNTVYYTVRNGDNLTTLGWKFEVKLSTLKYLNDISNADIIKPGQKMKIPPKGYEVSASLIAQKEASRLAAQNTSSYASSASSSYSSSSSGVQYVKYTPGNRYNGYPYGYCTYYVATKRYVPTNFGNARSWLYSAQRAGYSTGSQPAVGAIVVTNESWWGHVAYVERVSGGNITISEMNYAGWGVVSRRTISAYSGYIRGYVY